MLTFTFTVLRMCIFAFYRFKESCAQYIFSSITREISVKIENKVHHVNQLIEPDMMISIVHCKYIQVLLKKNHSTPLHLPTQNILLTVNPFHCFFAIS